MLARTAILQIYRTRTCGRTLQEGELQKWHLNSRPKFELALAGSTNPLRIAAEERLAALTRQRAKVERQRSIATDDACLKFRVGPAFQP